MSDTSSTDTAPAVHDEAPSRSLTETVRAQATSRQKEIGTRLTSLRAERDRINAEIKGLLAENEEVERLLRATKPKTAKG